MWSFLLNYRLHDSFLNATFFFFLSCSASVFNLQTAINWNKKLDKFYL